MPRKRPLAVFHPEILGGKPVFSGTRIPIHYVVDHLAAGATLDEFLDDYPDVGRERALAVLQAGIGAVSAGARRLRSLRPAFFTTSPRRS
jgi:uncharacterized protein (DUF433 family)